MEINYVCEFVVLAETHSFLEAADQLFIAQSSLTRHIKALEEELGAPLFDRTTRKVQLNAFGQLFLPYARQISAIRYEYTTAMGNALNAESGNVRIGSIPVMTQYHITDVLVRFRQENPRFTLDILEADSTQLVKLLRSNQCDFAFVREWDDRDNEFNKVRFASDTLAALLPKTHPLTRFPVIHLEQLQTEGLMLLGKDTFMYSLCMQECHKAGFEPRVVFTGHRAENIVDLVRKGMGVALLTKIPTKGLIGDDITLLDVEPRITTTISLAYAKNHEMSIAARQFLELVKTQHYTAL